MIKKSNYKRTLLIGGLFFLSSLALYLWVKDRPVDIVLTHDNRDIIIKSPPITDEGKITWWQKNEHTIKTKYGIPKPERNGSYSVSIWDFGDGYEIYRADSLFTSRLEELYCFDEAKKICLEKKNEIITIYKTSGGVVKYVTNNAVYYQKEDGSIVKED
ncbi:hypothetical protein AWY96_21595 [Serratia plymuthica]|uniref:DUF943 family protein n=1 Tax=Serratia plymuthica TaxID=82996 RepID=A0A7T2WBC4_SERPL|nr:DUF943 family protein [Serratia plymuthica]KYQ95946.1 hypothetical protein AWY96_21595 [Serratia plymuthica]QPS20802.1 DUF943 family protein [Serratia plymuthica]QPS62416.1 DUF943 family protein [Serratia plymuthica]RKS65290.1 putative membrane protein DUF943 [Serratia plymuthica]UNK25758.1 DUF943 family protein [Serratia plymuthica]